MFIKTIFKQFKKNIAIGFFENYAGKQAVKFNKNYNICLLMNNSESLI